MKSYQLFITSAFLLSAFSLNAEPIAGQENTPSYSIQSVNNESIEEELSFLDEEMDELEDEILALEEELKKDAESLADNVSKEPSLTENQLASTTESSEVKTEELAAQEPESNVVDQSETASNETDPSLVEAEESAAETITISETPQVNEPAATPQLINSDLSSQKDALQVEMTILTSDSPVKMEVSNEVAKAVAVVSETSTPSAAAEAPILQIKSKEVRAENAIEVNLQQAFSGSPIIYSLLGGMSVLSVGIWLYSLMSLGRSGHLSQKFVKNLENRLNSNQFDEAQSLCAENNNIFSKMVLSGISSRRHGLPVMVEAMKAEGKRSSVQFWQRIGLLNDIAIIAPMLGLLGTVLGMFYAFYDINRSIESISTLFDGLGVSVGTTVAGLVVAILALILQSTIKYRLVKTLAHVENEAQNLATLIDDRTSVIKG